MKFSVDFSRKTMFVAMLPVAALVALAAGLPTQAMPATSDKKDLQKQSALPIAVALKGAETALKACTDLGHRVTVAVVDQHGNAKAVLRGDGAGPHTVASATNKAFTAGSLRRSTGDLAVFIADKPELHELRDMDPRVLILAGGLPFSVSGEVVAGVGVGGAPSGVIDAQCAQAGIDKMTKELE